MGRSEQRHLWVEEVTHRYAGVAALEDVTLEIEEGELITLLGPSGCGKTTFLRILAGFIRPTSGRVVLEGREVTHAPPHKRPVNLVFQRPALFPHLDVFENVAFGLRVVRMTRGEIRQRVASALALVRLEGFERRRSHELSGGQMQRVALARALVKRPRVLLLDEPLAALDLKIRLEMEAELRRVHRETGATFVYVTHDQREALALSDRVVLLDQGRVVQVGPPEEIYHAPASPFAASFVGDANVIPVELEAISDGEAVVVLGQSRVRARCRAGDKPGPAWLVLRPEFIRLEPELLPDRVGVRGVVCDLAFRGAGSAYQVEVPGLREPLKAETPSGGSSPFPIGAEVAVIWDVASTRLLPRDGA